jgi:predicted N-acetyltransferase YhbS
VSADTSISVAAKSEARALAELRSAVALRMTEEFGHGHWSASPSRAEVVRQLRASQVLVARRGAEVIGTVRLVQARPGVIDSSSFTPAQNPLYVLGLSVAPQCRGQGVGRQLMEAAKDAARQRGAQALWLDAYEHEAGAGPFYMKCGFREVGRTEFRGVPLIYFEWLATRLAAGPSQEAPLYR